jgi:hypothetical protein
MPKSSYQRKSAYFLCIERGTYKIDLQIGKVYRTAPPEKNDPESMLRLVDDSGEDYLYPVGWFVPIDLPPKAKRASVAAGA